ncbi:DUF3050 domain-containing protein [Gramella sp. GC03-9]|uniref:DUF3050 domain-containing protein n=1 Tax=Christiangramia oceanisediminis TaxID=2920386 RepID=A0A9X2I8P4_9FLAO|nr:DUF3050 domain-containing protein [Gramella oceanisediminis]MCP9198728.1 DUF3050 domain-containing protein [Gramella oceanisediminis]
MNIQEINESLKPLTNKLIDHPLYKEIKTPKHLQIFMEHHVYAVWDFMSLLTALQQRLTTVSNPWLPVGDPEVRYLINEIVLAEETDINIHGKRQSHFEIYLDAMDAARADKTKVEDFLMQVNHGTDIFLIIAASKLPISIKQFLKTTFEVVYSNEPHKIASAFTFGREGLIPDMFSSIIGSVQKNFPEEDLSLFKYYFDRHIELDGDKHGPMAFKMVADLCGKDERKWQEVKETAEKALKSRLELWNGIQAEIQAETEVPTI